MNHPFLEIGKNYFVHDGVDYWIGRLVDILPFAVVLKDAAWIASTGRLSEFMKTGKTADMEIEPLDKARVLVQYRSIAEWPHPLFKESV